MVKLVVRWISALSLLATVAAVPACQVDSEGNVTDAYGNVVARVAAHERK